MLNLTDISRAYLEYCICLFYIRILTIACDHAAYWILSIKWLRDMTIHLAAKEMTPTEY